MKPAPIKTEISYDDFARVDIRVGTIERVQDVPKSDKLVRLTVNFGDHTRTVLAGIKAERDDPGKIEGSQALFVVNLAPRRMLFDLGYADGVAPCLAVPEAPVPPGTRAG